VVLDAKKFRGETTMKKRILIDSVRLALPISLLVSSAFAGSGGTHDPADLALVNTSAKPVASRAAQPYQATQTLNCETTTPVDFAFSVPPGKTLIVRNIILYAGLNDSSGTVALTICPDGDSNRQGLGLQAVGGYSNSWEQIQMSATKAVEGRLTRLSIDYASECSATVTLWGELM